MNVASPCPLQPCAALALGVAQGEGFKKSEIKEVVS